MGYRCLPGGLRLRLPAGHGPRRLRRPRGLPAGRGCGLRGAGLGLRRSLHLHHGQRPGHDPRAHRGQPGAEEEVAGHDRRRAQVRCILPLGAQRRVRRRWHDLPRREAGRQVHHQRHQVLLHQRGLRRLVHPVLQHGPHQGRPRCQLHRGTPGHARTGGGQGPGQDGPARQQPGGALLQRR